MLKNNFPDVCLTVTFERRSSNRFDTGIFSHPNVFVGGHEDWIDQQKLVHKSNIEMVFHLYEFVNDLVITRDEKMLCHRFYIDMVTYVFEYAFLMHLTNDKFSHRFYIEIVSLIEIDNEIVYVLRDRLVLNMILHKHRIDIETQMNLVKVMRIMKMMRSENYCYRSIDYIENSTFERENIDN